MATDLLFVYGTLMRVSRAAMGVRPRARLNREARFVGAATVHGRLFDLGAYPGCNKAAI